MMKALNRKLWRDLWRMKGQVFAITLVVMSGVATFIMFISTMDSLNLTRDSFYRDYHFADVFVTLKRAPESLKEKIKAVPGVNQLETRVSAYCKLSIGSFPEPVNARIISLPDDGDPLMNRLYLRKGRLPDPAKDNEAVINETFAQAHGFTLGDRFAAIINGKWKTLTITGIALSPEFVLLMQPESASPDFKRFGVLWMSRKVLSKAYDMDGAFNDVVLTLTPDAKLNDVLAQIDTIVEQYGGFGAYARKDQISHRLLNAEFQQLQRSSEIFPTIFVCVAAFLLNVVMSRTINTQREQIAALKAFGYANLDIGIHYAKLVVLIIFPGLIGGIVAGIWFGKMLGDIYMAVYRFPSLLYTVHPGGDRFRRPDQHRLGPCRHRALPVAGRQTAACRGDAARASRAVPGDAPGENGDRPLAHPAVADHPAQYRAQADQNVSLHDGHRRRLRYDDLQRIF